MAGQGESGRSGGLRNQFSWSYSRHGMFEECLRKYYLSYYGSWGGWARDADPRTRETYICKNLTTQRMWLGTVVHDCAEGALSALREGATPWAERAVELAVQRARRDIDDSRAGRYKADPKRHCGFQEHHYGEEEPDWEAAIAEISRQVRVLFDHPVFRRMLAVPERIVEVEVLRRIDIAGVPVYVKLDALMADGQGGLVIIDWKTGESHEDSEIAKQLGIYGIYAVQEKGVPVDRVQALHVNLRHNSHTLHPVDANSLDVTREFVSGSAEAMRSLLSDVARNEAVEAAFPMVPEGDSRCGRCRFHGICGR